MPNQWGDGFILPKSSPARPEADTVRQKLLGETDILLSANSLASSCVSVCSNSDGFKSYLAVNTPTLCHGDHWGQKNLSCGYFVQ